MATRCAGFSLGSLLSLPIVKLPAGSAIMAGQAGQSLMTAPAAGLAAGGEDAAAGAGAVARAGGGLAGTAAVAGGVARAGGAAAAPWGWAARRRAMRAWASAAKRPFG